MVLERERARALKFLVPAGARDAAAIKSSQQQQAACLAWCNARCNGWLRHLLGASLSLTCWFALAGANVYTSELCQLPLIRRLRVAGAGYLEARAHFCAAEREGAMGGRRAQQRVLDQHLLAFCDAPCGFDTKQELLL